MSFELPSKSVESDMARMADRQHVIQKLSLCHLQSPTAEKSETTASSTADSKHW